MKMKKVPQKQNLLQQITQPLLTTIHSKPTPSHYPHNIQMSDPSQKLLLQLQGECKITSLKFIRFSWFKTCCLMVPVILSVVGLWLLKHYKRFRVVVMYFEQEQVENATHVWIVGNYGEYQQIEEVQRHQDKSTFTFMKLKYEISNRKAYPVGFKYWQEYNTFFNNGHQKKGLDTAKINSLKQQFGQNSHTVDIPPYFAYMLDIMTKPFFIIQYVICVMFILQKIMIFAVLLMSSTLMTTSVNYLMLYVSYRRIKEIAQNKFSVKVVRDSREETIQSDQLYPGDVLRVEKGMTLPCDCLLLEGEAYVNEASLTGESVPVAKYQVQNIQHLKQHNRWLLEGSTILDCHNQCNAFVVFTGHTSRRGRIIRKITNKVYPDPQIFKNAVYFFLQSLTVGIIVYLLTLPILLKANITPEFRIYRFFDFIGFSCPPAFPIYFNLAYSFALYRLRKKGIFGTEPQKTVEAGFLKTVCFDKTGTLTENSLQIQRVYAFGNEGVRDYEGEDLENHVSDCQVEKIYEIFCSCHSVKHIDGKYLGDEVDLKMFEATKCQLEIPHGQDIKFRVLGNKKNLQVLKVNQFESRHQHMSVLVFDPETRQYFIFVKGAPEKIHNCSTKQYPYFDALLKRVSLNGLRSIGMAYRKVSQQEAKLLMKNEIPRGILDNSNEKVFRMVGLVTFENKLKADTKQTIDKLSLSRIESKIITGDNIFIAIETAHRSGILLHKQSDNRVIVVEGKNQNLSNQVQDMIGQRKFKAKLLIFSNKAISSQSELVLQKEQDITLTESDTYLNSKYPIAADNDFLKIQPAPRLSDAIKIYARITPENKVLIVKRLKQSMSQSYEQRSHLEKLWMSRPKIGMVGDGANDLMALKEADVGFGMSETDASYGAGFSISGLKNIEETIRESKSTCTIVLECLRYFGTISFLKIVCSVLMMTESTYFSSAQLSYFNFASTLIIPIAITLASPSDKTTPLKPLTNMLGPKNHLIYWGNIVIPSLSIISGYCYFKMRNDFKPNPVPRLTPEGFYTQCQTTTVVFLLVQVPFAVNALFLYNNGQRFKQPFYRNYVLMVVVGVNLVADVVFFFRTESLKGFLGLVAIPQDSGGVLVGITAGFCVVSWLWNWWVGAREYEKRAFLLEFPGETFQTIERRDNRVRNHTLNDTQAFEIVQGSKKNILSQNTQ